MLLGLFLENDDKSTHGCDAERIRLISWILIGLSKMDEGGGRHEGSSLGFSVLDGAFDEGLVGSVSRSRRDFRK